MNGRFLSSQEGYEYGYKNPSLSWKNAGDIFPHSAVALAYFHGQCDAQNQAPMDSAYDPNNYDEGGERKPLPVIINDDVL